MNITNDRNRMSFLKEIAPQLAAVFPMSKQELADWLEERGFFTAPASTKYHGACEGGLYAHAFTVARQLVLLTERNGLEWQREESPWLIGFFHDLCKIDQYKFVRNDEYGSPIYAWRSDSLLRGHGEKSVMLLATLTRLTEEEVACIRYHMGAFTDKELWNDYTRAIHTYPNVLWTHTADMIASHIFDT